MSYQVLARKWRPRTFLELVGQDHVQRALVNALDQGRLHHAYLFTGTRGVGKTTLARILAKCLNCTAGGAGNEGVTSTPCGECPSCQAIDQGRFVDLIEVDAASRTKVEDTRELLDNVQYLPTQGRYKVYLIDEVHMLSTSSFNALLKTLEEPPPHVKFLLATTDPQKLPATVLSRCLQFTLKHMPPERVVGHLSHVLEAEQVPFEESALWLLGKAAQGSMRDAMSLTDQAIAFGQGEVRHADVAAMLGTLDHRHVLALIEALAEIDASRLLGEVARLAEQGPDFAGVLDDVTGVLHRLAIAQMVPEAVDNSHGDRDELLALAARFTAEDIQLYYQVGVQGRGDMAHAPDLRSALEMTLLRMLAFRPQGVPRPANTPLPMRGDVDKNADKSGDGSGGGSAGENGGGGVGGSAGASHAGNPQGENVQSAPQAATQPVAQASQQNQQESPNAAQANSPQGSRAEADHAEGRHEDQAGAGRELETEPEPGPAGESVFGQAFAAETSALQQAVPAPEPDMAPPAAQPEPGLAPQADTDPHTTPPWMAESVSGTTESAESEPRPEVDLAPVYRSRLEAEHQAPPASVEAPWVESGSSQDQGKALPGGVLDHAQWLASFESLGLSGLTRNLAAHCVVEDDDGSRLVLRLDPALAAVRADVHERRIHEALSEAGYPRQLVIKEGALPDGLETPQQQADRRAAEQHAWALDVLRSDPNVQALKNVFGAEIDEASVKPL
jgi:DNA polymerase-3 subunit gamma/tau